MRRALVVTTVGFVLWEAVVRLGFVSDLVLAPPSAIIHAAVADGAVFARALALTAGEIAVAVVLAWACGITFGFMAGSTPVMARIAAPLLAALFAVPLKIFYPLLIAWLGLGPASKIAFGSVLGFFPLALTVLNGVRAIDPRYRLMAQAVGASRFQVHLLVVFPLALPAIASGLRIATALVVIGVLGAEILASLNGIGYLISYHQTLYDTGHIYLGILLALALVFLVNYGITRLERRLSWKES